MSSVSASSSAVDGLISGLDTSSIITKLLEVDAAPQTQLKNSVTTAQSKSAAYQAINTKVAALATAANAFTVVGSTVTTTQVWSATSATVSGGDPTAPNATATAASTAAPGSISFKVDRLATAASIVSAANFNPTPTDDAGKTALKAALGVPFDVVQDGHIIATVSPSVGSLADVTAAINKAKGYGLTAMAVRLSDNNYRLQITSNATGDKGEFRIVPYTPNADGSSPNGVVDGAFDPADDDAQVIAGANKYSVLSYPQNASITVPKAGGGTAFSAESSTNTFSDVLPGVTITATKATPTNGELTRIQVATNPQAVSDAVKALVDAANAALTEISSASSAGVVGSDGKRSDVGALNGDLTLRTLKSQILNAVTSVLGSGASATSAAKYGLQSTSKGELTFDSAAFLKAYTDDPKGVQKALAPSSLNVSDVDTGEEGVFERLQKVATAATTKVTGTLSVATASLDSTISDLTKRISDWDTRLATKKAYYAKYYSNLEVALGKLQNQSTWLAGQLSSLSS